MVFPELLDIIIDLLFSNSVRILLVFLIEWIKTGLTYDGFSGHIGYDYESYCFQIVYGFFSFSDRMDKNGLICDITY